MNTCGNCNSPFSAEDDGLVVTHAGQTACAICPVCLRDSATVKLVLRRATAAEPFAYLQYSVLEMAKRAFGKTA